MKIYVDSFHANSDLTFEDFVDNLMIREDPTGVVSVFFETTEKYAYVNADSTLTTPEYSGEMIEISPIILDEEETELREENFERYIGHPDYYVITLVVETGRSGYVSAVTPLKHQYFVNFIPHEIALYRNGMEPAMVIEWIGE